jgi:hypothetical protein
LEVAAKLKAQTETQEISVEALIASLVEGLNGVLQLSPSIS